MPYRRSALQGTGRYRKLVLVSFTYPIRRVEGLAFEPHSPLQNRYDLQAFTNNSASRRLTAAPLHQTAGDLFTLKNILFFPLCIKRAMRSP
jgi:hypothetical protein